MNTIEERLAVLKAHRQGLAAATTFESFKAQQLAFVDFLIEDMELDLSKEDHVLKWIAKVEVNQ